MNRSGGIWVSRSVEDIVIRGNIIKNGYYGINIGTGATNTYVRDNKNSQTNTAINNTALIIIAFNTMHDNITRILANHENSRKYNNIVNGIMN